MYFTSKSLKEISNQVLADLKESLGDPRFFLGASPLQALAYAMSGVSYMLHVHLNQLAGQLMPDTAKRAALVRWATILSVPQAVDESEEELRARILYRLSHPSRGGTKGDFIQWIQAHSFVGKAWVYPAYPVPGSVGVTCLTKDYKAPLPKVTQLSELQADLVTKIPLGTQVQVFPMKEKGISFKLVLGGQATLEVAKDAIQRLLFECALPETTLPRSKIQNILSEALRGEPFELHSPAADLHFEMGEFGTIQEFSCNLIPTLNF